MLPVVIKQHDACQGVAPLVQVAVDSALITNLLPAHLFTEQAFDALIEEVPFEEMLNKGGRVPRLVCYQGIVDENGSVPIYRVPSDDEQGTSPFTPTVLLIKQFVEQAIQQPLNHCLIQYYRNGFDYISEHADKTLDITRGSKIVNLSLGATRTMRLHSKNDYGDSADIHNIPLPHNSLFVLGWDTNKSYVHSIKQDKRMGSLKSEAESAFGGRRISFTFRSIATFRRCDGLLYGQGAYCKSEEALEAALAEGTYAALRDPEQRQSQVLVQAFSMENRSCDFDWGALYGRGFDITRISCRESSS